MYTILATIHTYGSIATTHPANEVKPECERLRKVLSFGAGEDTIYKRIEVINNDTGEVREYWNNHNNEIKF